MVNPTPPRPCQFCQKARALYMSAAEQMQANAAVLKAYFGEQYERLYYRAPPETKPEDTE